MQMHYLQKFSFIIFVCVLTGDISTAIESILRENVVAYRLPNHTHPESYDLTLSSRIDLNDFDFDGVVKIRIFVDSTTREIVLHGSELSIRRIRLARYSGSVPINVPLLPYNYDGVRELVTIATDGVTLTPGDRLLLEIVYSGTFRIDNTGFFRTSYINFDGNET